MSYQPGGFVDLRNGMNNSRNPLLLPETQCSKAINVSFRGGLATTRPSFVKFGVELPEGVFRGMGKWSLESGDLLVFAIDSWVYTLKLDTATLVKHTELSHSRSQCFFLQAAQYLIVQDGWGPPVVLEDFDGTPGATTASSTIPPGYFGAYAHGRIHMVPVLIPNTSRSGRASLISSDIMLLDEPSNVLQYEEGEYLSEGGAHAMPLEMGFIGGLGVLRNANTGTGAGAIIALGRDGVCAFDFSISRDLWKSQPISQSLFTGSGCRSPWAVVSLNNDLVYRGIDGLRTLRYTGSQAGGNSGALSNTPLSQEVDNFFDNDFRFLSATSMAVSENRLFTTAMATSVSSFGGLVVWDVGAAYYSGVDATGAYDGLWTGAVFSQVLSALYKNRTRLFVMSKSNVLYYLGESEVNDPNDTPIECRIESKAYPFGDLVTTKKLLYVELWLQDLVADTTIKLWYRPHGYPLWKEMGERTVKVPPGSMPQSRRRLRFSIDFSVDNCDPVTGEPLYVGTAFQLAIQWVGRATIGGVQALAEPVPEQPPDPCDEDEGFILESSTHMGETFNDLSYSFED